jgi:peptidoglycan/LPS O-acetylase OafA/YrhL
MDHARTSKAARLGIGNLRKGSSTMGLVRFLLALCVFAGHDEILPLALLDGTMAVRGFFVISGFYMALILNEKYRPGRELLFYSNRALRLLPPYLLVLFIALAALLLLDAHPFSARTKFVSALQDPWTALLVVWSNLLILGQDLLFLVSISPADASLSWSWGESLDPGAWRLLLLPQGWSLALELTFYACAPLLVRRTPATIASLGCASLLLHQGMIAFDPGLDLFARRFLPAELFLFLMGALSYRLLPWARSRAWAQAAGLAGLAGFMVIIVLAPLMDRGHAVSLVVLWLALGLPFLHVLSGRNRLDRRIGDLSYPLYLVHFTVIAVAQALWEVPAPPVVLASGLGAAVLLWLTVDRPLDALRQNRVIAARVGDAAIPGAGLRPPALT